MKVYVLYYHHRPDAIQFTDLAVNDNQPYILQDGKLIATIRFVALIFTTPYGFAIPERVSPRLQRFSVKTKTNQSTQIEIRTDKQTTNEMSRQYTIDSISRLLIEMDPEEGVKFYPIATIPIMFTRDEDTGWAVIERPAFTQVICSNTDWTCQEQLPSYSLYYIFAYDYFIKTGPTEQLIARRSLSEDKNPEDIYVYNSPVSPAPYIFKCGGYFWRYDSVQKVLEKIDVNRDVNTYQYYRFEYSYEEAEQPVPSFNPVFVSGGPCFGGRYYVAFTDPVEMMNQTENVPVLSVLDLQALGSEKSGTESLVSQVVYHSKNEPNEGWRVASVAEASQNAFITETDTHYIISANGYIYDEQQRPLLPRTTHFYVNKNTLQVDRIRVIAPFIGDSTYYKIENAVSDVQNKLSSIVQDLMKEYDDALNGKFDPSELPKDVVEALAPLSVPGYPIEQITPLEEYDAGFVSFERFIYKPEFKIADVDVSEAIWFLVKLFLHSVVHRLNSLILSHLPVWRNYAVATFYPDGTVMVHLHYSEDYNLADTTSVYVYTVGFAPSLSSKRILAFQIETGALQATRVAGLPVKILPALSFSTRVGNDFYFHSSLEDDLFGATVSYIGMKVNKEDLQLLFWRNTVGEQAGSEIKRNIECRNT